MSQALCIYAFPQVVHERCAQNYALSFRVPESPHRPDRRLTGQKPFPHRAWRLEVFWTALSTLSLPAEPENPRARGIGVLIVISRRAPLASRTRSDSAQG